MSGQDDAMEVEAAVRADEAKAAADAVRMKLGVKPTLGRIVLYTDGEGVTRPAIVTAVWSNTCVNLTVFASGDILRPTSVEFGAGQFNWSWPPRV